MSERCTLLLCPLKSLQESGTYSEVKEVALEIEILWGWKGNLTGLRFLQFSFLRNSPKFDCDGYSE